MVFSVSFKGFCLTLPAFNHFYHKVTLNGSVSSHNHFTLITAGSNHMITMGFDIKAKGMVFKSKLCYFHVTYELYQFRSVIRSRTVICDVGKYETNIYA